MNHERAGAMRDRLLYRRQNFFAGKIDGNHVSGLGQCGKIRPTFAAHDFGSSGVDEKNFPGKTELMVGL
jgi:hypothetical protein